MTLRKQYLELMRLRIRVAEAEIEHARRQLGESRPAAARALSNEEYAQVFSTGHLEP